MSPFSAAALFCLATAPNEEEGCLSLRHPRKWERFGAPCAYSPPTCGAVEKNFTNRLARFDVPYQRGVKIARRREVRGGGGGKKREGVPVMAF